MKLYVQIIFILIVFFQTGNLLSDNKNPHGSIISSFAPRHAHVLITAAVFWGISGSNKAIIGLRSVKLCVILSVVKLVFYIIWNHILSRKNQY